MCGGRLRTAGAVGGQGDAAAGQLRVAGMGQLSGVANGWGCKRKGGPGRGCRLRGRRAAGDGGVCASGGGEGTLSQALGRRPASQARRPRHSGPSEGERPPGRGVTSGGSAGQEGVARALGACRVARRGRGVRGGGRGQGAQVRPGRGGSALVPGRRRGSRSCAEPGRGRGEPSGGPEDMASQAVRCALLGWGLALCCLWGAGAGWR